ncbi:hypothetical protein R6Z07M_005533 [Ovis aries]
MAWGPLSQGRRALGAGRRSGLWGPSHLPLGLTVHAGAPVTVPQSRSRAPPREVAGRAASLQGHVEALLGCPPSAGAGLTVVHPAHLREPTREPFCCQNRIFETKGPRTSDPGGLHAPRSSHRLQQQPPGLTPIMRGLSKKDACKPPDPATQGLRPPGPGLLHRCPKDALQESLSTASPRCSGLFPGIFQWEAPSPQDLTFILERVTLTTGWVGCLATGQRYPSAIPTVDECSREDSQSCLSEDPGKRSAQRLSEKLDGGRRAPVAPRVWFVPDALGIVCASATWALTLSEGALLLSAWLLPAQQPAYSAVHGSLFHLLASLALASHARTMFTDPGALPAGAPPAPGLAGCCPLCGAVRPPGAHHCRVCQRCIRRAHHHCPWVNNCVGEDNRKFFVLFTLYTALGALHVLLLLSVPALRAYARGEWDLRTPVRLQASLLFLFMVALNGFLFAGLMFTIQMHSILTDPQSQPGEPGQASAWTNLKAVLGPRPSPAWISPFASAGPRAASGPQAVV